jgi:hypothetical protein
MFEDVGPDREYRTGDYWTFAARYLTGDIEWPEDEFLPPHGIVHSFAPLAVVRQNSVDDLRILKDTWIV